MISAKKTPLCCVVIASLAAFAGCGGAANSPVAPTLSPPTATAPSFPPRTFWRGDAVATAVTYGTPLPCGAVNIRVGDRVIGIDWEVAIDGARIVLDEDMRNWPTDDVPLTGTLSGAEFSASYSVGADYLRWACQFKEATLSGRFSADFNSFEAMETLVWGPPNAETTVHRRWTVTRQ